MFQKIPKIAVYAALFMIPLFTLPFTVNALDFQKQFLLFIVASVGIFFWIWNALNEKKLNINLSPLNYFAVGLVAAVLVSSIFSLYRYGSLWGTPLPVAESFVATLSFIFLYFLIVSNFKKDEIYKLVAIAAVSATIAAAFGIMQSFGVFLLPFFDYTKITAFNTVGTVNGLVLYAAIVLAMIFPMIFAQKNQYRKLMTICGGLLFLALVFFNGIVTVYFPQKIDGSGFDLSIAPWAVLAISALAVFVFLASDHKFAEKNIRAKGASFAVFSVALLFLVFNFFAKPMMQDAYDWIAKKANVEIAPDYLLQKRTAADIAVDVLKQSPQMFFLGSGPGTFIYDFVKLKPKDLNQYNAVFFNGSSEIINRIATLGLLGLVALLLVVATWTIKSFRILTEEREDEGLPLAVFSGWLAMVAAMFFYPFNFCLAMLFWFLLALIILQDEEKMAVLPLKSVRLTYAVTLIFIAVMVLQVGLLVWCSKRYYAEAQYLSALKALQKNDIAAAINRLGLAAEATERLQDNYLTGLSQIYLAQANQEISKQGENSEAGLKAAAPYLQNAINIAALSTDVANPSNSSNWAFRGYVYRQLIGVSDGFDTWAVNMYQKALALEPNNPALWVELGQVYVLKNDLTKAKESFGKAIELRPQMVDPHYYLALINDQQGDKEDAINELTAVWQFLPQEDTLSRDNVAKAIESLKQGGSLGGQQSQKHDFIGGSATPKNDLENATTTTIAATTTASVKKSENAEFSEIPEN